MNFPTFFQTIPFLNNIRPDKYLHIQKFSSVLSPFQYLFVCICGMEGKSKKKSKIWWKIVTCALYILLPISIKFKQLHAHFMPNKFRIFFVLMYVSSVIWNVLYKILTANNWWVLLILICTKFCFKVIFYTQGMM